MGCRSSPIFFTWKHSGPEQAGKICMRHFCTYFDQYYVSRGVALYESLLRHCARFELWVLCMDDSSYLQLRELRLKGVRLLRVGDLERDDPELRAAKSNRSTVEYYFTCTPSLPLFVFRHDTAIELLTYIDADLFFYADPEPLFMELGTDSVGIIAHRFTSALRHMEAYGIYNVGMLQFRNDERGVACLAWWRARCLEWCHHYADNGRYGDQKYLDDWPTRFDGVKVLEHKGANVAVWNLGNHAVSLQERQLIIGDQPLIFFHFHGIKRLRRWVYDLNVAFYGVKPDAIVLREIYAPYFQALWRAERCQGFASKRSIAPVQGGGSAPRGWREKRAELRSLWNNLVLRNYMMVVGGRWLPLAEIREWIRR